MIKLFDTTLRDGTQGEGITFSANDKLKVCEKLDELGIHYIEGGWPGSNPKDVEFFKNAKSLSLSTSKISAFGSTRRAKLKAEEDPNLKAILDVGTDVASIFGKSWDFHVIEALKVPLEKNLDMIYDSIKFLKDHGIEVIYDAEHFFDGYKRNKEYALATIKEADKAGADCISLCDTNGGSLPFEIGNIITEIKSQIKCNIGIHAHNDSECAVANSLEAVKKGAVHVQGTINGYGERCGNANLCSIIPGLKIKMKLDCVTDEQLSKLKSVSAYIAELGNISPDTHQPYVGSSAFAHKGGIHVSAIQRHPDTYEHIRPELVGNRTRVIVSELSGRSNIIFKAREYGVDLESSDSKLDMILERIKKLENEGYQFEGAEASFELLMKKALGTYKKFFELEGFRVVIDKRGDMDSRSEATIKLRVNEKEFHTAAEGKGPVNALDKALRKALIGAYPEIKNFNLTDYKVRVLEGEEGTGSIVRVLIRTHGHNKTWDTVGVSENIITASWYALVDSVEYGLAKFVDVVK